MKEASIRSSVIFAFIAAALTACSGEDRANGSNKTEPHGGSPTEAEAYMRKAEADWAALSPAQQPALLNRILADDFVGVGTTGVVRNKREQIEADAKAPAWEASHLDYVHYRHFGDTVLAQGQESVVAAKGQPPITLVWTDVWMFRNGKWQMVAAQDTVLKPIK